MWSPDSGYIVSADQAGNLYALNVSDKKKEIVDTDSRKVISDYSWSPDSRWIAYSKTDSENISSLYIHNIENGNTEGRLQPESLRFRIDPVEEWEQIFNEAWRIERDFFYDSNMHGTDWEKMKERYSYLLPYLTSRHDLNYVIGEMVGELSSSHTYVGGGDIPKEKKVSTGMLGCDFDYDEDANAYVVSRVYEGGKISPHLRSPLMGNGVKEGDLTLEVNVREIDTEKDPWTSFQGLANQIVSLTVGKSGSKEKREELHLKLLTEVPICL